MNEFLLQFIWQHKLFDTSKTLKTIDGKPVVIVNAGLLNSNAGPDFLEAKIIIDDTLWAGHVELHLKSSDWKKHHHQKDKKYNNLILHVVYEFDGDVETENKTHFPSIELKGYIHNDLLTKYDSLLTKQPFIACEKLINQVSTLTIVQQKERMLIERLEQKTDRIAHLLKQYKQNWQEVFYIELARAFGIQINQDAFEKVALHTPFNLFAKHKLNIIQIEAILFGQAGFLNEYFDDAYPNHLSAEYTALKKKYQLHGIDKSQWKFLRLRPANFPTLRIAQFAQLLYQSTHLFSQILEAKNVAEIEKLFQVTVSSYWLQHYTFQEISSARNKSLGQSFIHIIIINCIVPMIFLYGKMQGKENLCKHAIELLKQIPSEQNSIITKWQNLGIEMQHAEDSQALLQLKKHYCDAKKCLQCSIGYAVLKLKV